MVRFHFQKHDCMILASRHNDARYIISLARCPVKLQMPAKQLELRHTIQLIRELDKEIDEIEASIEENMNSIQSP